MKKIKFYNNTSTTIKAMAIRGKEGELKPYLKTRHVKSEINRELSVTDNLSVKVPTWFLIRPCNRDPMDSIIISLFT